MHWLVELVSAAYLKSDSFRLCLRSVFLCVLFVFQIFVYLIYSNSFIVECSIGVIGFLSSGHVSCWSFGPVLSSFYIHCWSVSFLKFYLPTYMYLGMLLYAGFTPLYSAPYSAVF